MAALVIGFGISSIAISIIFSFICLISVCVSACPLLPFLRTKWCNNVILEFLYVFHKKNPVAPPQQPGIELTVIGGRKSSVVSADNGRTYTPSIKKKKTLFTMREFVHHVVIYIK